MCHVAQQQLLNLEQTATAAPEWFCALHLISRNDTVLCLTMTFAFSTLQMVVTALPDPNTTAAPIPPIPSQELCYGSRDFATRAKCSAEAEMQTIQ